MVINRSSLGIAQGNAPGRPGERVQCVGCHLGHVSGSLDAVLPLAVLGWGNIAPSAVVTATSEWSNNGNQYYHGRVSHLSDRHNYVLAEGASAGGPYADTDQPWIASSNQLPQAVQAAAAPLGDAGRRQHRIALLAQEGVDLVGIGVCGAQQHAATVIQRPLPLRALRARRVALVRFKRHSGAASESQTAPPLNPDFHRSGDFSLLGLGEIAFIDMAAPLSC